LYEILKFSWPGFRQWCAIFSPIFANRSWKRGPWEWWIAHSKQVSSIARESSAPGRHFPGCDCCKVTVVGGYMISFGVLSPRSLPTRREVARLKGCLANRQDYFSMFLGLIHSSLSFLLGYFLCISMSSSVLLSRFEILTFQEAYWLDFQLILWISNNVSTKVHRYGRLIMQWSWHLALLASTSFSSSFLFELKKFFNITVADQQALENL
jgi:hypothetical protein